jgi:adenylate cyclase
VLYGPLGATGHAAMTAVGEPVNLATRLEAAAPAGGILVCEATSRRTATCFAFERVPDLCLHGFAHRSPPAACAPPATSPSLTGVSRGARLASSAGRRIFHVRTAWEQAACGWTTILELRGEAGIGKSRLARELLAEVSNQARLISIRSSPYDQATAFGLA